MPAYVDPWGEFEAEIREVVAAALEATPEEIHLTSPPAHIQTDIGVPLFPLARKRGVPPQTLARQAAERATGLRLIGRLEAAGPFLNVYVHPQALAERTVRAVLELGEAYGGSDLGAGKTVVVDYSSPNVAKPMSVGHLRSTVIGDSLKRIFRFLGYRAIGDNHIGDWGTQFGKLLAAYTRWGEEAALRENPIQTLLDLYVRFHREAAENPELEEEGRAWFKRLEDGDPEARSLWQTFVDLSVREFKKTYALLGIEFEYWLGESFYEPMLGDVIREALEKGVAVQEPDGPVVVDLSEDGLGSFLLRKRDGATLYITRDLACAIYRFKEFKPDRILYVVGQEQTLHFRQLFRTLEKMGYPEARRCVHVAFGLMRLPEGKMSTRQGRVVFLEDVLREAIQRSRAKVEETNPDLPEEEKDRVARMVGIGAVKYNDLYQDRKRTITFDWDAMLNFEGNSAPYIQYAHARCRSILRRAGGVPDRFDPTLLTDPREMALIREMARFPGRVREAAERYAPNVIAEGIYELARALGPFYRDVPVLKAETPQLRDARLALVAAVAQVIRTGLNLLGIEAPERM